MKILLAAAIALFVCTAFEAFCLIYGTIGLVRTGGEDYLFTASVGLVFTPWLSMLLCVVLSEIRQEKRWMSYRQEASASKT